MRNNTSTLSNNHSYATLFPLHAKYPELALRAIDIPMRVSFLGGFTTP